MKRIAALALAISLSPAALAASQRWAFELRIGPYHPQIDNEPGLDTSLTNGEGPYQYIFGNHPFALFEMELDYQIVRLFGTLGVGLAAGHFIAIGHGVYANDAANQASCTADGTACPGTTTGDTTSLRLVPVRVLAVWRVDEFWLRWRVPLVPYLKLGFGPTFWWIDNGQGNTSYYNHERAAGSRWGPEAAGGLGFVLDWLDPIIATDMRKDWGIDHTYLFAEFRVNRTGTMGKPGLDLADNMFTFGLAFEF